METTHGKNELSKAGKKMKKATKAVEDTALDAEKALEERVATVKDFALDLRDRAELAIHERPYLLPVATGAIGLGVGVLIGSKVSRVLAVAAAGALLNDQVRGQVVRFGRELLDNLADEKGSAEDIEDVDDAEPSVT